VKNETPQPSGNRAYPIFYSKFLGRNPISSKTKNLIPKHIMARVIIGLGAGEGEG
jgi:hypothetical protein